MTEHAKPPYAEVRVKIEDEVRLAVDQWPEHVQAVAFMYLRNQGWDSSRALNIRRKAFGGE